MRGISEERLRQFRNDFADRSDKRLMDYVIRDGCQELNQWMPIESAPKDREILFYYPPRYQENGDTLISSEPSNTRAVEFRFATHWMELPSPPELPEPPSGN